MVFRLGTAVLCAALLALAARPAAAQSGAAVLVVGGTPAGVAAAVAAAREGAQVTLVSARPVLGGVLTDAMMDQWDLNTSRNGEAVQGGLFREIHAALGDAFTPDEAAREFGRLVDAEPRIHLMLEARPTAVTVSDADGLRRIDAVTFARRNGSTFRLAAASVVDATDDGDVAAMAGAPYDLGRQDTGRDEAMQPVTLMFTLRGIDWPAVQRGYDVTRFGPGGAGNRRAWGYAKLLRAYRPLSDAVVVRDLNFGREPDGAVTVNAIDVLGIDGRSPAERDRARAISERETPRLIAFLRERLPGCAAASLGRYADAVYVRETRHFAGVERLTADDVWDGRIPPDTVGLSSYPLDLHPVTPTDRLAYAPERHVYGVPFGTLVPCELANLALASPAISATHIASGSARVIPTTIEEGEAAGTAAAIAESRQTTLAAVARSVSLIGDVRAALLEDGAILSYREKRAASAVQQTQNPLAR